MKPIPGRLRVSWFNKGRDVFGTRYFLARLIGEKVYVHEVYLPEGTSRRVAAERLWSARASFREILSPRYRHLVAPRVILRGS